jgi:hypothetical protein
MLILSPLRAVGLFSLAFAIGCSGGNSKVVEPKAAEFDPAAAAEACIKQFDKNGSGSLDPAELADSPGLKSAFESIDADKSKSLSNTELTQRFTLYRGDATGAVPVAVVVVLDDVKVDGATVTFEPEAFFGGALPIATGTTDADGVCTAFTSNGSTASGLPCGIYKVKIEKAGAAIPAKYNSATVLGQEIVTDGRAGQLTLEYKLSSR